MKTDQLVAGLDIGTSKVAVVIGQMTETGFDVIGVGSSPNTGIRKGTVVNIEQTTASIQKAREEAELMAGARVEEVWLGIAGSHIQSFDSKGIVAIRNSEVTAQDVERVIEAAKTVAVPADRQVLHVIPRDYKIDEQDGIGDPIGMTGVRLEASVHIVTAGHSAVQNIVRCAGRADLKVAGLVLEPLSCAVATLTEDEKSLGVAVVEMGAGTTDLIMFVRGSIAYTASVPLGGTHVTNDVAVGLRTSFADAENLKKKYGCALSSLVNKAETIEVEGVGGRREKTVSRFNLCEIIEPRVEEILNFVNNEIQKSGLFNMMGAGIVLTGGASQLDGLCELGEFVFDMPVRLGGPHGHGGLTEAVRSPAFTNCMGLVSYGFSQMRPQLVQKEIEKNSDKSILTKMKTIINGLFNDKNI